MLMVQVHFEQGKGSSIKALLVWVDASWNLVPGNSVTFKGEENPGHWLVKKVYPTKLEIAELQNTKWGLDLPKSQRTER